MKKIGEIIKFFSSENKVLCEGIITAIIITEHNIFYKAKINSNDNKSINEYINTEYDHKKYHYDVYIFEDNDITDDFNLDLI